MRKNLVTAFSIIYMVLGLLTFVNSLFPYSSSPGFIVIRFEFVAINLFSLISGVMAFYAGMTMLRLYEFGRKFVIMLLSIRMAANALAIVQFFLYRQDGAWLGLSYLGEQIYRIENRYAYPVLLVVGIIVALLSITFLSQRETKKIFTQEIIDNIDSSTMNSIEVEQDILI